jgi:ElaB/YqjD/DUF883 family membrane-anchored ribosome-binding protein
VQDTTKTGLILLVDKNFKNYTSSMTSRKTPHESEPLEELTETGRRLLEEAAQSFKKKTAGLKDKTVSELSDDLKDYVKTNPIKSVLIAAGAGFLLGWIFKRDK